MEAPKKFSVLLRLQKVTTEYAYVLVPVTEAVLGPADAEGHQRIDPEKFAREGARLAADPDVRWIIEGEPITKPHPLQTPLPSDYQPKNFWE